jgi:methylated-DNA-protein-cysteine methyltransferase-like protein
MAASRLPSKRKSGAHSARFESVYEVVARIPKGTVVTYGQIAAFIGSPRGARTVAWALHSTPSGRRLPTHRVVNASGALSPGHVFGEGVQRARLESEGVTFRPDGRIDLERHVWLIAGK